MKRDGKLEYIKLKHKEQKLNPNSSQQSGQVEEMES